mgnify:CR=1 FL=1
MDVIDAMRCFAAVVGCKSFTGAAAQLGLNTNLVSKYVRQLEERLGVRLLNRTTRSLALTEAGQAYYERCLTLLEDFDELEAGVQDRHDSVKGHLLVSAPGSLGVEMLMRGVTAFIEQHPQITIELRLSDRFVNIVDEGFDLAIRIGELPDSSLIARRLAPIPSFVCASPAYLAAHGTPEHPKDLDSHHCVIDTNLHGGAHWPFRHKGRRMPVKVKGAIQVNSVVAIRRAVLEGGGIAWCPGFEIARDIREGRLVSLLEPFLENRYGIYAVYPHNRHLAAKIRAFVDFLVLFFARSQDPA